MVVPFILLALSVAVMVLTWNFPDVFLLALLSAVAAMVLLLLAWRKPREAPRKWAVIDGSNVMYWQGGVPKIEAVKAVVEYLTARGYAPSVMFDANAGYLLADHYMHDGALARQLGLPVSHVMVVPKGVQADPYILAAARDKAAPVVSNDRFRDWAGDYPEVTQPEHCIRGNFRDGVPWLNLPLTCNGSKPHSMAGL
ncbi:NYN domain-containing protein [Pseudorhodobacter aquimaris]|uniref:NYN domain-containing protein n=1 Tax=Pseudorhodobacter aquimaris TaxID=687412 RepID=UPI00067A899B|nr:hypothetical protein [Pseudorhodobacter aquimaris]